MTQAIEKKHSIKELLESPAMVKRMNAIVPKHLNGEQLVKVCLVATERTPKLKECDALSLLGAMMSVAALGLPPNTPLGLSYLIPFWSSKKKSYDVQLIVGFKGFVDLAKRAHPDLVLDADVVYEQDEWSYEKGSNAHLRHVPKFVDADAPKLAYAYSRLGSAFQPGVLPWSKILRTRDNSSGHRDAKKNGWDSVWDQHLHEMAKKTAVRYLSKMLQLSPEFQTAAVIDARSENGGIDFATLSRPGAVEPGAMIDVEAATVEPEREESKSDPLNAIRDKGKGTTPAADEVFEK